MIRALDAFNRRHPWSHNDRFGRWVVRQVRRAGARSVLDVGCGTGGLLLRLSTVAERVTGLEPDPATAALAAQRCAHRSVDVLPVPFDARPRGQWDAVTLVASLHHLPLAPTSTALHDVVTPGGVLVVVGVAEDGDLVRDPLSLLLNPVVGLIRHPRPARSVPTGMTAPVAAPHGAECDEVVAVQAICATTSSHSTGRAVGPLTRVARSPRGWRSRRLRRPGRRAGRSR